MFSDDIIFLCKAEINEIKVLNDILKMYGEATYRIINLNKSSITSRAKVEEDVKVKIKDISSILNGVGRGTYLGLSKCFSGSKIEMLSFIQDTLKSRVSCLFGRNAFSW